VSRSSGSPPSPGRSHLARHPRDQLEEADRLRQQRKLDRAEAICYPLVRRYPGYVAALHTLGLVYLDKGNFERALDCLVRASMLDPTNWVTLTALSLAYLRLGASEAAAQSLERALAIRPRDASIYASLGEIHRDEREHEFAQHAYREALTLDPRLESAAIGLALCSSALGQFAEAAEVLSKAYELGNRSLNLLQVMTTLPQGAVHIDVLGALDRLAADGSASDAESRNSFSFARAAALDGAGRHAEAWQTLVAANLPLAAQYQAELTASIARREQALVRMRSAFPNAIQPGGGQPVSLFILGPSRSGKTSLERLISSWDGTKVGCEAAIVEKAVRRTFQVAALPPSNYLEELPPQLLPSFREIYLETLVRRAGSARMFTNTLPGRIHDAGLIAAAVPNVRFLMMKRSFDDVAWRIYMTKYLSGNAHAYDLRAIRAYLNWYNTMIDLIAERLPEIARVVDYESMIDDPAGTLREVRQLCGLGAIEGPVPALGNDRNCAAPYRELMAQHG
jgi:Flp pilus assembly protein TadD